MRRDTLWHWSTFRESPRPPFSSGANVLRFALLILLGLLWSGRLAAIKAAGLSGVPVHVIVSLSVFGIALMFVAIALVRRVWPPFRRDALLFYALTGVFGFVLPFILESLVAPNLSLFVLLVIISTMPIITLIGASLLQIERPKPAQYAAILLGFCVALLIAWDTAGMVTTEGTDWIWVIIAFGIPVFYAGNSLFVAACWPKSVDAMQVACAQALLLSCAVLLGSLLTGTSAHWPLAGRNLPAMLAIIVFETFALLVYLKITRDYGATFMSLGNYIAIVFAAVLGVFLFDDQLTGLSIAAAGLLVASLSLNQFGRRP